jgi:hypothetical protein
MVLCSLHRLTPLVQRLLCVESPKGILIYRFDSRDVYHCPVLFSRSTDFSAPLRLFANFGVRVSVSIVAGGSLTTKIVSNVKPSYKDGVSTHIFR